jgi:hypothetical protein
MKRPTGKLIYCRLCWRDWWKGSKIPENLSCEGCKEAIAEVALWNSKALSDSRGKRK